MTATSARLRGVFILICGLPLLAFGLWLMWIVLARPLPDWLPEAIRPGAGLRIEGLDASSTDEARLRRCRARSCCCSGGVLWRCWC